MVHIHVQYIAHTFFFLFQIVRVCTMKWLQRLNLHLNFNNTFSSLYKSCGTKGVCPFLIIIMIINSLFYYFYFPFLHVGVFNLILFDGENCTRHTQIISEEGREKRKKKRALLTISNLGFFLSDILAQIDEGNNKSLSSNMRYLFDIRYILLYTRDHNNHLYVVQ